jgi:hypothetical protein
MSRSAEEGPTDPLRKSGYLHLRLKELDDGELDRFLRYWEHRYDRYRESGDGFSAWKSSNILSAGLREANRRGLIEWPPRLSQGP